MSFMLKIIKNKGTILLITFLILGILFLLGSYFLTFTLAESRISKSQEAGAKTYYLAEAGVNEAIWKLRNDDTTTDGDPSWADDFADPAKNPDGGGIYWSANFSRSFPQGSYTVSIQNSALARGEIVSSSTVSLPNGQTAQRIVKTAVFKALGSPVADSALLSGGSGENIDINFSRLRIYKGNLFSNHNLDIKILSTVEVYDDPNTGELEGKVLAVGNFGLSGGSTLTATSDAICAKNSCTTNCDGFPPGNGGCPPASVSTPLVDFDSSSQYSFKTRAQNAEDLGQCEVLCNGLSCDNNRCVFPASDFKDLLWQVGQGGTLTLNNEITYITGDVELRGGRHLIVNGALVADDNIKIGERFTWPKGGTTDLGLSQITINRPGAQSPSGLLTKRKINFGLFSSFQPIDITGVIYANEQVRIVSAPQRFDILGGIVARKFSLSSVWQWLNITLDDDIILYGLGYKIDGTVITPTYSPIITIDHWEESY